MFKGPPEGSANGAGKTPAFVECRGPNSMLLSGLWLHTIQRSVADLVQATFAFEQINVPF